jgi:hypothetical protein
MALQSHPMNSESFEENRSRLRVRCIFGLAFVFLAAKDLLAWSEFIPSQMGWLTRVTGADSAQPIAGLILGFIGAGMAFSSFLQIFSERDNDRRKARQFAILAALAGGAALVFTLETLIPSKELLVGGSGVHLATGSRQAGLMGLAITAACFAGFIVMRRRDVGFWTKSIGLERENEIWRVSIKVELAFRGLSKNEEVYRMVEQRIGFIQAEVGAKFDKLCEQLIKESADLSTIDSTARLQMDVGHVFKRYADFHRRLAEVRHKLFDEIMKVTYDAVAGVLENKLPGQNVRPGVEEGVNVSVSYPVFADTRTLQKRRAEWDDTLRGIVSIGATTGNQIVGEWIDRASRGDIKPDDLPAVVEMLRSTCGRPGVKEIDVPGRPSAPALDFSPAARELHDWLGKDQSIDDPAVAGQVRTFFSEKKLLLADCNSPEVSAERLLDLVRAQYGGILTLQSIAAAFAKRAF